VELGRQGPSLSSMELVTIVTGGSRGIGAATARRLAAAGHRLVISYRRDREAADEVAAATGAIAVQADVTSEEDVDRLFAAAAALGQVTGLVSNAGVTSRLGKLVDAKVEDLRRVVDVNLVGALLCARRAAAVLPRGGAIVNISSGAATLGSPNHYVHYAAAKAGVDALTIGLAKELAPAGIRVNAVAPGIIRTEIHAVSGDPDRPDKLAGTIPLGRPGEVDEVSGAIAWLLSPEASYTTGAILRVTGGL
jgi:NAD(P)-dependent dehydrogenase (short-subunit alcohol dehydrogenase family)